MKRNDKCSMCKNEPASASHGLGPRCYNGVRNWSANKTAAQRRKRAADLLLYGARVAAVDDGTIKINHIRETADDKVRGKSRNAGAARSTPKRNTHARSHARSRKRAPSIAIKAASGSVH